MGLLELPDLRHTLVDISTTLLCISGYNGLPGQTLPINLIRETACQSERVTVLPKEKLRNDDCFFLT